MSVPCGKSELLLFNETSTQICCTRGLWKDIHPLNSIDSGPIQFVIRGSEDMYLDLNDTVLYLKLKIEGSDGVVNLLLSSLFSDVQLTVGETIIEGGDHMYPYKSYISNLLNYDKGMKKTQLAAAGFMKDIPGKFDDKGNSSFVKRIRRELMGSLNLSFFMQSKYLLPGVDVKVRLNRSKNSYCMMNFGKSKATIDVTTAILYVRQVNVMPSVLKAHNDGLSTYNAIYPYQRQNITNFTIAKDSVNENREILVGGATPKLVIIGMVENSAFNGDFTKNPFNFKHFNINFMALLKNGESTPAPPLQLDFENNIYLRAYINMIQNLEFLNKNESNAVTIDDFANGTALFCFNLTPDLSFGASCAQKFETTNLRLDLKFAEPLATSINVIIYSLYDAQVEISKDRQVWCW